jgi:hypothetical protein
MSDTAAPASLDPIVVYDSEEEEVARQLGTHSNRTIKNTIKYPPRVLDGACATAAAAREATEEVLDSDAEDVEMGHEGIYIYL